eukprot:TRINITY_DN17665_c0_g1_i4.p1 TRINITY_DN17665_c0_g1~~TRINITY_DN17665_c0_g1_i4.p1  ORF type:complete len:259 (-),score=30.58 TRINITY_DN17665_c0_g1_i4:24-800(-)
MSGESVYNVIQEVPAASVKGARFQSSRAPAPTASTFGLHGTSVVLGNVAGEPATASVHPQQKSTGSFGRTVLSDVSTADFLKKSGSQQITSPVLATTKHEKLKAPIPKKEEKPVMGLKTDKNFVVANAVENILSIPKKQSAQQPRAVDRADYGAVPEYISKIKTELKTQYSLVDSYKQRKAQDEERYSLLDSAEVQQLRYSLQRRWEVLNKEFQTMGFSVETYSQKRHQDDVEKELRAVEAALQKINKPVIYIYDDTR